MLNLDEKIKESLKEKNSIATKVFRAIKAEKQNFITAPKAKEYTDTVEIQLINRLKKQRIDSINQYSAAGRTDLVDNENQELLFLQTLLPPVPTKEEIRNIIIKIVEENNITTLKNMGFVIQEVMKQCPSAPGIIVSAETKSIINERL